MTIPLEAFEQYFRVELFIILYKMALWMKAELVCNYSNESYKQYFHVALFNILRNVYLVC